MNNKLATILHAAAAKMRGDFEQSRAINHRGEAGSSRERILADFLTPLVPGHVRVAHSGEILSVTGDTSPQCDVVLYDQGTPPLLDTQASRIFTSESVYSVIEVKTTLDNAQLIDACEKIRRVKVLPKSAYFPRVVEPTYGIHGKEYSHYPTLGVIFAFAGGDLLTLRNNFAEWCSGRPLEEIPDSVWVLGKGWLQWVNRAEGKLDVFPCPNSSLAMCAPPDGGDVLLPLALYLNTALAWAETAPVRLLDYAGGAELGNAWADVKLFSPENEPQIGAG